MDDPLHYCIHPSLDVDEGREVCNEGTSVDTGQEC